VTGGSDLADHRFVILSESSTAEKAFECVSADVEMTMIET
jgi:hypothetical protein